MDATAGSGNSGNRCVEASGSSQVELEEAGGGVGTGAGEGTASAERFSSGASSPRSCLKDHLSLNCCRFWDW